MLFWGHVLARWHANLRPNCAPLPPPRLPGQPGATAGWAPTAAPSPATPTPRLSRKGLESGITGWLQRPKVTQGFLSAPGNFLLPNPTPACPAPSPSHPFPDAPAAAQATFPRGTPQLPAPCPLPHRSGLPRSRDSSGRSRSRIPENSPALLGAGAPRVLFSVTLKSHIFVWRLAHTDPRTSP